MFTRMNESSLETIRVREGFDRNSFESVVSWDILENLRRLQGRSILDAMRMKMINASVASLSNRSSPHRSPRARHKAFDNICRK